MSFAVREKLAGQRWALKQGGALDIKEVKRAPGGDTLLKPAKTCKTWTLTPKTALNQRVYQTGDAGGASGHGSQLSLRCVAEDQSKLLEHRGCIRLAVDVGSSHL